MVRRMTADKEFSISVLGSGKGSNFEALAEAADSGRLRARLACVVSDVADAGILERARRRNIPCEHISAAPHKTKLEGRAEDEYIRYLKLHNPDVIALAGFMRIIKPGLLNAFGGRVVNIHPSLLPAFPGFEAWKQAMEYGSKIAGCTVHFVDLGIDTGPIILQRAVEIAEGDTPESLHARIQKAEHAAYPEALELMRQGRLSVCGRRVEIRPPVPGG